MGSKNSNEHDESNGYEEVAERVGRGVRAERGPRSSTAPERFRAFADDESLEEAGPDRGPTPPNRRDR